MSEPKGWKDLRPEVQQFALLMEEKLRLHDETKGKTAWKEDEAMSLLARVDEEAKEMSVAIRELEEAWPYYCSMQQKDDMELLISNFVWEAVDVANMAMMVADVMDFLRKKPVIAMKANQHDCDVPNSRWDLGPNCIPVNPQPIMMACWSRGEMCPDRVQDSDDPKDEIKAIRRTLAYLVKRQWDQDALDISMKNESDK